MMMMMIVFNKITDKPIKLLLHNTFDDKLELMVMLIVVVITVVVLDDGTYFTIDSHRYKER